MPKVFCVRAKYGQYASAFIDGGYTAIGWIPQDSLKGITTDDQLKELYIKTYPNYTPVSLGQQIGQISRFLFEIQPGDIVVTPTSENEKLAVGKVTGDYYFQSDEKCPYPHRKSVMWLKDRVIRTSLSVPLQNTLRSMLAVYRVKRGDELARAAGLPVPESKATHAEIDLYRRVLGQILELSPDDFEILVTDLLTSIGFDAEHVGRQGDGGIDVTGNLKVYGFASMDLRVQVKRYSLSTKIGAKTIRDFRGSVPDKSQGAFVATCSFNKKAYEEAIRPGYKRIGLIDGKQLVDIMVDHYENISQGLRDTLKLRRALVPEE